MRGNRSFFGPAAVAAACVAIFAGVARGADAEAVDILNKALRPPATSYKASVSLRQWQDGETNVRTERAVVFFAPPDAYRMEFLRQDGTVDRAVLRAGHRERIEVADDASVIDGRLSASGLLDAEAETALLLQNYAVRLQGEVVRAGRPAWQLDIAPRAAGKPRQSIWVDQETFVVLAVERSEGDETSHAAVEFTGFEPGADLPAAFLAWKRAPDAAASPELGQADLEGRARVVLGRGHERYAALPGGFALSDAEIFEVNGQTVRHLRYTDGLVLVSLFRTDVPVRIAPEDATLANGERYQPGSLAAPAPPAVHAWRSGRAHFTLIGGVTPETTGQIESHLR